MSIFANFIPVLDELVQEQGIYVALVYGYIYRAGANSVGCYASHETMATTLGMSVSTVQRSLKTLEETKYIERVGKHDAGTIIYRTTDVLRLKLDRSVRETDEVGQRDGQIDKLKDEFRKDMSSPHGSVPQTDPDTYAVWLRVLSRICGVADADGNPDYENKKFMAQVKHCRNDLMRRGFTIQDVYRYYHDEGGSPWYMYDFRGQKKQPPKPSWITDTITQLKLQHERTVNQR